MTPRWESLTIPVRPVLLCLSLEFCFLDVYPSSASPKVLPESQCVEKHILSTPL